MLAHTGRLEGSIPIREVAAPDDRFICEREQRGPGLCDLKSAPRARPDEVNDHDLIAEVQELLRLHLILLPRRQEVLPEAAQSRMPPVAVGAEKGLRDGEPLDLGIEQLKPDPSRQIDRLELVKAAHDLDVLPRHNTTSISEIDVATTRLCAESMTLGAKEQSARGSMNPQIEYVNPPDVAWNRSARPCNPRLWSGEVTAVLLTRASYTLRDGSTIVRDVAYSGKLTALSASAVLPAPSEPR